MPCPHCASIKTNQRPNYTVLGYRRFRCRDCQRTFNERTGTVFNHLQYPTDVVCLVVLWRHRYKLSLRDVAEMFLQGINAMDPPVSRAASMSQNGCGIVGNHSLRGGEFHGTKHERTRH